MSLVVSLQDDTFSTGLLAALRVGIPLVSVLVDAPDTAGDLGRPRQRPPDLFQMMSISYLNIY